MASGGTNSRHIGRQEGPSYGLRVSKTLPWMRVDPGGRAPVQQTAQDRGRSSGGLGGTEVHKHLQVGRGNPGKFSLL